jgi:hypothetical protein
MNGGLKILKSKLIRKRKLTNLRGFIVDNKRQELVTPLFVSKSRLHVRSHWYECFCRILSRTQRTAGGEACNCPAHRYLTLQCTFSAAHSADPLY